MAEVAFTRIERRAAVAIIHMIRPDRLNALDAAALEQLGRAVAEVVSDRAVRCAVLTGEGRAFVAGADIEAMRGMTEPAARAFAELGHRTFDAIEAAPLPFIAAVNGFALGGGCELALACDFILAADKAKLGQPEVKLGVIPGFGGTQRLARRVGMARARELIYTGRILGAEEAAQMGLVQGIFPVESLLDEAVRVAQTIADMSPAAVAAAKGVMRDGEGLALAEANALERAAFASCFAHPDQGEGMAAFIEKRPPTFAVRR